MKTKKLNSGYYLHLESGYYIVKVDDSVLIKYGSAWQLHNESYPSDDSWAQSFATKADAVASADALAWTAIGEAFGAWKILGRFAYKHEATWTIQSAYDTAATPTEDGEIDGRHLVVPTREAAARGFTYR